MVTGNQTKMDNKVAKISGKIQSVSKENILLRKFLL